jgi:hypothetical protein
MAFPPSTISQHGAGFVRLQLARHGFSAVRPAQQLLRQAAHVTCNWLQLCGRF